ncbi:hypothetical protein OEZ86_004690 [Tetradesmus obliquus]|nr:hypothetical protein OEZ86_004690 [Tetradesmus obliquus]
MCSDDVEIFVSGQVRLQCSPVRQRQQLSDAAQCNAEEAADEQVAKALAVAASRSPDRAGSGAISAAGGGCKGGCVRRVAGKRQVLVGRMQDEIGLLQRELAELREMMPGAYA